jgi:hypothetical protein
VARAKNTRSENPYGASAQVFERDGQLQVATNPARAIALRFDGYVAQEVPAPAESDQQNPDQ